jgi:hypothetical protein
MEAAMANITLDSDWIGTERSVIARALGRITHRLRVLARRYRIDRAIRRKVEFIRFETTDPRILIDIGIDPARYQRSSWLQQSACLMRFGPL